MSQEKFIELITKELIGELLPDEDRELQNLIKANPSLKKLLDAFQLYWTSDHADKSNDQVLFEKITSRIRAQEPGFNTEKIIPLKKNYFKTIWKAAAAIFLLGSAVWLYTTSSMHTAVSKKELLATNTVAGQKKMLVLPDGTKVTINADSKLSFPAGFTDSTRDVYLTGEAFFDVHKDHAHPFIIHTGKMDIRVLGTAFNVKAYPNDKFSETTLIRGVIQVTLADRPTDRITLKPTEKLIVNYARPAVNGTGAAVVDKPNALPEITYLQKRDTTVVETSWLQNKLIFKDQDFETLANSLERRYNVNIQFKNDDISRLRFTGIFEKETIAEALNALKLTESFKYRISKDKILIY